MLYSVIPPEVVWQGYESQRRLRQVRYGGISLLVEEAEDGSRRVERLLSTDPQDYMQPMFQPGQYL